VDPDKDWIQDSIVYDLKVFYLMELLRIVQGLGDYGFQTLCEMRGHVILGEIE